ncbi:MAG: Na/Pi cotransporter family protein [Clostridia bacterium]|nr:Na/Pi cotransporter family protein [Clostridia bacterium]
MDFFNVLTLLGGLALFLFGMEVMGKSLEKSAGNRLKIILAKLTSNPIKGFLLGLVVTCIIQSSSATTVMVVGFVNSGVMLLEQSINIIIGANVGTAVTSWLLSLTGIESSNFVLKLFKPDSLAPICGVIGILMYMGSKKQRKKDFGMIFLGFAALMFGMEIMSDAVKPLAEMESFKNLLVMFSNPILGVIVGTVVTAIIQSSSASVGILQALSMTGAITFSTAIPIVVGQNIGTCVTALISSTGATRDARRASMIHLYFNVLGGIVWMGLFYLADAFINFAFMDAYVNPLMIAVVHTVFKVLCTALFLPLNKHLLKLASLTVKEKKLGEEFELLDERLFLTPAIAVDHAASVSKLMAVKAKEGMQLAMQQLSSYSLVDDEKVVQMEDKVDQYEDKIGSYLVKLSSMAMEERESLELTKLLHMIGDLERISDHSVNIVESAREMHDKELRFSEGAMGEMQTMISAVNEILEYSIGAFTTSDMEMAMKVEPLEETIDTLRDMIKAKHIERLKQGDCTIELGFVLNDLLTNMERVSDHCSNVAMCLMEVANNRFDMHGYQHDVETKSDFTDEYSRYMAKFMPTKK